MLSAGIIALYTMHRFSLRPSLSWALFHAVVSAFTIDIRLTGLIIPVLTIIALGKNAVRRWTLVYGIALITFVVLFWPYLWENPVVHFFESIRAMSRFDAWSGTVRYFGALIKGGELPWHYIPVWIGLTTPFAIIVLCLIGVVLLRFRFHRFILVSVLWWVIPLVTVISLRSVLYDDWRQMYFIYPGIVLTALSSLVFFVKKLHRHGAIFLSVILGMSFFSPVFFMIQYHPYQNLYFNRFITGMRSAKTLFDVDYWGLTFRKGFEYIARNDQSGEIPIFLAYGHRVAVNILPNNDRTRFKVVDKPEDAKYILTNYRWQTPEFPPEVVPVYDVKIDGVRVMSVFQLYE